MYTYLQVFGYFGVIKMLVVHWGNGIFQTTSPHGAPRELCPYRRFLGSNIPVLSLGAVDGWDQYKENGQPAL
jgi:hypothetical protein